MTEIILNKKTRAILLESNMLPKWAYGELIGYLECCEETYSPEILEMAVDRAALFYGRIPLRFTRSDFLWCVLDAAKRHARIAALGPPLPDREVITLDELATAQALRFGLMQIPWKIMEICIDAGELPKPDIYELDGEEVAGWLVKDIRDAQAKMSGEARQQAYKEEREFRSTNLNYALDFNLPEFTDKELEEIEHEEKPMPDDWHYERFMRKD